MRRRTTTAVLANPVLVGAVTVLVVVVAVFLAYNANNGLPFVPTFELRANVPDAAKLVRGNDVREGGSRIGVVSDIQPIRRKDGTAGAEVTLKLDEGATPIPADTSVRIRPRSALGLKYVELQRGTAADTLPTGSTVTVGGEALAPELQEFFNIFDRRTRIDTRRAITGYGDAFAFRGADVNQAIASLPRLVSAVQPVMERLAAPEANLAGFFRELADAARVTAPVAAVVADGFVAGSELFEALDSDPEALQETIAQSPETLAVGTTALRNSRPFLRSLAGVSDELRVAAGELRASTPAIGAALVSGIEPLQQLPALNARLETTFRAVTRLSRTSGATTAPRALNGLMETLNPLLRHLGPYQTVCNYWNYSWYGLSDHITDTNSTGTVQRIRAKSGDAPRRPMGSFDATSPVPGLHSQTNGAAVTPSGEADCETGQRGFPRHLAEGIDDNRLLAGDSVTPGAQGPTFRGRPAVPAGQTFSAEPEGIAPDTRNSEVTGE